MNNLSMLNPLSRIWIYQASRSFSVTEFDFISQKLNQFVADWSSHGKKLEVASEIKYNRFVIIAIDESQASASGCSIDKAVHFMTEIGEALKIDFLDRNLVYLDNDILKSIEIKNIKSIVLDGILKPETIVFDNTITTLELFKTNWQTEAKNTWLKRYFVGSLV